jgi:hypothetical protein
VKVVLKEKVEVWLTQRKLNLQEFLFVDFEQLKMISSKLIFVKFEEKQNSISSKTKKRDLSFNLSNSQRKYSWEKFILWSKDKLKIPLWKYQINKRWERWERWERLFHLYESQKESKLFTQNKKET